MGGDLAPSFFLGGREKTFADQTFELPFLGKQFRFNAENF